MSVTNSYLILLILLYYNTSYCNINKPKKVLVIGGSGRVGGSAVRAISKQFNPSIISVTVGGRKSNNWLDYKDKYSIGDSISFIPIDIYKPNELKSKLVEYDVIVNTAGPFQGLNESIILKTCLVLGKKYIDVCDDINLSRTVRSKEYQDIAKSTNAIAIISTGIWPGGSSLLAKELIERNQGSSNIDSCIFSFFTAGSGGAGPTILTATFLILGEEVLTYNNNQRIYKKSATDKKQIDFGKGIGLRDVVRLNLIECESCHISGVPNVETYFGTAPRFWNTLFTLMANVIPSNVLKNRRAMEALALFSLPLVRLIDAFVGSTNGIKVDITTKLGEKKSALMTHKDMEDAVGISIAAFVTEVLYRNIDSGVYFPEEISNEEFRKNILSAISDSAISYEYI